VEEKGEEEDKEDASSNSSRLELLWFLEVLVSLKRSLRFACQSNSPIVDHLRHDVAELLNDLLGLSIARAAGNVSPEDWLVEEEENDACSNSSRLELLWLLEVLVSLKRSQRNNTSSVLETRGVLHSGVVLWRKMKREDRSRKVSGDGEEEATTVETPSRTVDIVWAVNAMNSLG
jgi:hypothetical protein